MWISLTPGCLLMCPAMWAGSVLKSSVHADVPKTSALSHMSLAISSHRPHCFCAANSFGLFWSILRLRGYSAAPGCLGARVFCEAFFPSALGLLRPFSGSCCFSYKMQGSGPHPQDLPNSLFHHYLSYAYLFPPIPKVNIPDLKVANSIFGLYISPLRT